PVQRSQGVQQGGLPVRQSVAVFRRRAHARRDADPHMQSARLIALAVLGAALSGPLLSDAAAAPAWLQRHDLSAHGEDAAAPRIALDAAGDAVAVWRRFDGADYVIQSAARPAGGSWSAPVDLSAPGEEAQSPQLAVDAAGDAVAVWTRFNGAETGTK